MKLILRVDEVCLGRQMLAKWIMLRLWFATTSNAPSTEYRRVTLTYPCFDTIAYELRIYPNIYSFMTLECG